MDSPVLVTGATGFIGAELVRALLEAGERVRGTTRSVDGSAAAHLMALPGAMDRLELVELDLLGDGWESAMAGCERVFHVASPFVVTVDDPERDLLRPAVEGTLGVLAAAHANGGIRRVVLTSSVAAIADGARSRPSDESDWNEDARIDRNPYAYSKTQAERAAWEFTESVAPAFDLIVMNPSSVIGPTLVPRINQSHVWFTGMTDGSQPALVALDGPMVDVRDVASAHLAAMGAPEASGRYIVSAWNVTPRDVFESAGALGLRDRYRFPILKLDRGLGVPLSKAFLPFQSKGIRDYLRSSLGVRVLVDGSRAERELGITYRSAEESLADTWRNLDEWGLLGRQS